MTERVLLPNRRHCLTEPLAVRGHEYTVSAGIDPETLEVKEVFLSGAKEGSEIEATMSDAAVALSIALQCGVRLEVLAKSMGRLRAVPPMPSEIDDVPAHTEPASVIGAALDHLCRIAAEIRAEASA